MSKLPWKRDRFDDVEVFIEKVTNGRCQTADAVAKTKLNSFH